MFNDAILKKCIFMYKCALFGIYFLVYRFAFAENNVASKWDRVIFTDKSTFRSANDGPVLVYRPQRELYNTQYMSTCKRSGRVSVHFWSWISNEGAGVLIDLSR
jgi:deoxyadenosine/deoxycytidine kinase